MVGTPIELVGGPADGLRLIVEMPFRILMLEGRLYARQPTAALIDEMAGKHVLDPIPYRLYATS